MDQKKTGYFFKQLRNDKKLTQEQLRENLLNQTGRWKRGKPVPIIP